MANADRPHGARPVRHMNGSTAIQSNPYTVDAANATAIFLGDFVKLENDGNITAGSEGGLLLGVCVGIADDYGDLTRRYLPDSTAGTVMVTDDPDMIYAIQEDDGGTALTAEAIGENCDVETGAGGSTTTSLSSHEIDRSTSSSAIAQLRLLRLVPREDNAHGDWAEWEVYINEHQFRSVDLVGTA